MRRLIRIPNVKLCLSALILLLFSCGPGLTPDQRSARAAKAKGEILIGVVRTSAYANFFLEGVNLAVNEINAKGGLLGRKLKILVYDDEMDPSMGERIASELASDDDVVAVVGHGNSNTAIPSSVIYEKAGIAFISYGAKDPDLTLYSGNFTFRNIPTQNDFGLQMARFAHENNFQKTAVFYVREASYKSLADIFKKEATALGIECVATRSYFKWERNFKEVIAQLKKDYEFDSVLVSGIMPAAAELVKQLREMGVTVPILGGDGLDSLDLFVVAGRAAEGITVPTVFNPDYPQKTTRLFVRRFHDAYGLMPDTWAAQGYDAISLVAHAIEQSGSSAPIVFSANLRFLENWNGITGNYAFTPRGDITNKEIFFKQMRKGEFIFLSEKQKYDADLFNYIEDFTLRLPLQDPITTLDPSFLRNGSDVEVCEQLFLGLTSLEPKSYNVLPELAKSWKKSQYFDDLYIFQLRDDVTWSNGELVTSEDILWAIQRNLNPDTNSPNAADLYILKNAEALHKGEIKDIEKLGVYLPSDYTIVFKLEHPAPYFPALVSLPAFRPLPQAHIEKHKEKWTETKIIQTNGPYKPILWQQGKGLFLKKNPQYYDADKVAIREVRYYIIPQSSVGLAMYENNELDIMGSSYMRLPSKETPRIKKGPLKDQYHEDPHFCTYAYAFNTKLPPVDNPLVRKALSAAIDRQLLIDALNEGNGEPASTCTRPPLFGALPTDSGVGIRFNPSQARQWLAEAGYPQGKNFPEITILYRKSGFHKKIAHGLQALLQHHLGITVKVQSENENDYLLKVTQGNPAHLFRAKICNEYPDANSSLSLFDPSQPYYATGWTNPEFSHLMQGARLSSDPEHRQKLYRRAEEILCQEEVVLIPLYFEIYHSLVKPRVKRWSHMAIGGQHLYEWYFETQH